MLAKNIYDTLDNLYSAKPSSSLGSVIMDTIPNADHGDNNDLSNPISVGGWSLNSSIKPDVYTPPEAIFHLNFPELKAPFLRRNEAMSQGITGIKTGLGASNNRQYIGIDDDGKELTAHFGQKINNNTIVSLNKILSKNGGFTVGLKKNF